MKSPTREHNVSNNMILNLKKCQPVILNYVLRAVAAYLQYRNIISGWNVNKSANRLYIYAPNVEGYHLQFISQIYAFHLIHLLLLFCNSGLVCDCKL
jgi:hypothetical protein